MLSSRVFVLATSSLLGKRWEVRKFPTGIRTSGSGTAVPQMERICVCRCTRSRCSHTLHPSGTAASSAVP
jgi:hypothetical protein